MSYIQCVYIVKAKNQIAPSKAVVGFDLPMEAHYLCIYKSHIRGKVTKAILGEILQKPY